MGIFENKETKLRRMKEYDDIIQLVYEDGVSELPKQTSCELALLGTKIAVNPLRGSVQKVFLDLSQVNSVSVLPWAEYSKIYQCSEIFPNSNNSVGRIYIVISYTSATGDERYISLWGALQYKDLSRIAKKINSSLPPKIITL